MTLPGWLTVAEFAERTGIVPNTVRIQIANGKIGHITRIGRQILIAESEVVIYLTQHRRSPR